MKVAIHLGVHCTDERRLVQCLEHNKNILAEQGIDVPDPDAYQTLLKETLQILSGNMPSDEVRQVIIEALLENEENPTRVVFSHDTMLCRPDEAISNNTLYPSFAKKAPTLASIFQDHELEFFLAIRNPATLVPALLDRSGGEDSSSWINGTDPASLRWSECIADLQEAVPDAPVTVWCNEDSPLIWPQILQAVSGHNDQTNLAGTHEFLTGLMGRRGVRRLEAYLRDHPPSNEKQRQKTVAAFLDRFADEGVLDQEIDMYGWTQSYVDTITNAYFKDIDRIEKTEGIRFLSP